VVAQLLGEVVDHRVEFADELNADLPERGAGVVPQRNPVTHRVGREGLVLLERVDEAVVSQGLGSDPVRIQPVALALMTTALARGAPVRRHVAHLDALADEELRQGPAQAAGALDPDAA
jgi:hypothetical protein